MRLDSIREMIDLIKEVEIEFKKYSILASDKKTLPSELETTYKGFTEAWEAMVTFRNKHEPEHLMISGQQLRDGLRANSRPVVARSPK
jgi:hypothetical protein